MCKLCIDIFKNKKRIDLLVNNAGIPHGSLFMTTSINDLTNVISANFMSHINISQICARLMMKGQGKIVNISQYPQQELMRERLHTGQVKQH